MAVSVILAPLEDRLIRPQGALTSAASRLNGWVKPSELTGAGERVGGPSDFFVVTAPQRSPGTAAVGSASETVAAESRMAFIVVVPATERPDLPDQPVGQAS